MNPSVAILAGGLATRLHPLTLEVPKSLVKVNGQEFIAWQLELLAKSGINSVILCLGHRSKEIIDFVGDGERFGLRIQFSVEENPLGTGGALKKAESLLGEVFGVIYGDSYLRIPYDEIFKNFFERGKLGLMTVYRNTNKFDKSNVYINDNGEISYSKKNATVKMQHIDYGFNVLSKEALKTFSASEFYDLSDLLEHLANTKELMAYEVYERFYEIGSFKGIVDFERYLEQEKK